jgi:hypothetical protein
MAKPDDVVSVRIEISNFNEVLRLYHALGDLLIVARPLNPEGETGD